MECCGVLPVTQFAYQKGLCTCDALLCVSHPLQSGLENGQEAGIVQIDFSAAFYWVNHRCILHKFCSNRSQHVMVDSCQSKHANMYHECWRAVF